MLKVVYETEMLQAFRAKPCIDKAGVVRDVGSSGLIDLLWWICQEAGATEKSATAQPEYK